MKRRRARRATWRAIAVVASGLMACSRGNLDAIVAHGGANGATDAAGDAMDGAGETSDGRVDATDGGGDAPVKCPSPALGTGDTTQMLQIGSVTRSYLLHVPSSYTGATPVPLIIDFHSLAVTAQYQRMNSTFPAQVDAEGVVMAFPQGLAGPSGTAWNVGPCCVSGVDDVAFTRQVILQIQSLACIDPNRIYAAGFSMGGGMANQLACQAADLIAGIAPSAFDLLQDNIDDCQPARPITVISFRGTSDPIVPYGGGRSTVVPGMPVTFLGAQATFQKWAQLDGCTGNPSTPDGSGCSTYSTCAAGVQVTLCTDQGGGQAQGDASFAWPILKQHPRP